MRRRSTSVARRPRRGATLFITVLFTSLMVCLLGLASLTLIRVETRQADRSSERMLAQHNARSSVELALNILDNDGNWRNNYTSGTEVGPYELGATSHGTISWWIEDSDGSLIDDDTDLRLVGIGRVGDHVQVDRLDVTSPLVSLDVLNTAVYATGDVLIDDDVVAAGGPVVSAQTLETGDGYVGDVEANVVVDSGSIAGSITTGVPPRSLPSPGVFDTYRGMATEIAFADLDAGKIHKQLLSGMSNPYGFGNANATYHIHVPAGEHLKIEKSRILGCLLVTLENNAEFELHQENLWEPPMFSNHPSLIIKALGSATVKLKGSNKDLDETSVNYNPFGSPYEGSWDFDRSDSYPSKCTGLFHIIGSETELELKDRLDLTGTVLTEGSATLGKKLDVTVDPGLFTDPPDGYLGSGNVSPVAGSWKRGTAP